MNNRWGEDFKIHGMNLKLSSQVNIIERKTYNLLELLGDVGGLYDALMIIGSALVAPVSAFKLRTELLSKMFHTSDDKKESRRSND